MSKTAILTQEKTEYKCIGMKHQSVGTLPKYHQHVFIKTCFVLHILSHTRVFHSDPDVAPSHSSCADAFDALEEPAAGPHGDKADDEWGR